MQDHTPKKPGTSAGVNTDIPDSTRRRWDKPGTTATVSLLSEGLVYCDECNEPIIAEAVYVERKLKGYRPPFDMEIVALLHPACYQRAVG